MRQNFGISQGEGKAQICFDFTKGVCTRGDKCKYSHDLATIVHFNSKEKGICFDYLRNQCHRGLLCRFSHDLSNIAQQCQVRRTEAFSWDAKPLHTRCETAAGRSSPAHACRPPARPRGDAGRRTVVDTHPCVVDARSRNSTS